MSKSSSSLCLSSLHTHHRRISFLLLLSGRIPLLLSSLYSGRRRLSSHYSGRRRLSSHYSGSRRLPRRSPPPPSPSLTAASPANLLHLQPPPPQISLLPIYRLPPQISAPQFSPPPSPSSSACHPSPLRLPPTLPPDLSTRSTTSTPLQLPPRLQPPAPPAMATEQPSEKKKPLPPPSEKKPLPKVVTLNKALKLAQTWVDKMSASELDELNDKDFEGRPSRLGLGAKVALNGKRMAPTDPVERRLLGKVNAQKRKSMEENKTSQEVNEASDDDSAEPESRTGAFNKKRTLPLVTAMPLGNKAK